MKTCKVEDILAGNKFIKHFKSEDLALTWQSKKLKRVVRRTLAAGTLAAVESVETGFLLTLILKELHNSQSSINIECFTDNQSLFEAVHSTNSLIDKHLQVDMAILRGIVHKKEMIDDKMG